VTPTGGRPPQRAYRRTHCARLRLAYTLTSPLSSFVGLVGPPPTARQQRYLRQLALQRGVSFVLPKTLGLNGVPVIVRDAVTADADRAVENIASCRCRHDAINADRAVMPMSELECCTVRGEVGITNPDGIEAARLRQTTRLKWGYRSTLKASTPSAGGDTLAGRPFRASGLVLRGAPNQAKAAVRVV
jgi:hypothetical protein